MFCEDTMEDIGKDVDKNFYVDDYLASTDSVHDAVTLAEQLGSILKKGGFRLTKGICNCLQVIKSVPLLERADAVKSIDFDWPPIELTLGVNIPEKTVTRRSILSSIASLYDPRLCKSGLGWDVEIPEDERTRWFKFLNDMQQVENIFFPRCMLAADMDQLLTELHIFSDASEVGYGVVAYSQCYVADEETCCRLILAKARPQSWLLASVRSCRLNWTGEFAEVVFWTDSMIVLNYIRIESSQFKAFVANQVSTIHNLTKESVDMHSIVDEPGMHQLHYHRTEGHVGSTQVMATVREKFWMLRGGTAVKRIVGNCIYCQRRDARPAQQLVAPLPLVREGDDYGSKLAFWRKSFGSVGLENMFPSYDSVTSGQS
ncbi:Gag-Pol polyprotein [Schistosoma japonicum]|uniref:Gag-Pol polyprotein n=1 Tax=Schistosoma japonicum TaxID=6182 RepID=A0A4Z2DK76_SCHJA|nr:Gag-Pol polyprotein [Schistosoma japonicum]